MRLAYLEDFADVLEVALEDDVLLALLAKGSDSGDNTLVDEFVDSVRHLARAEVWHPLSDFVGCYAAKRLALKDVEDSTLD